MLTRTATKPTHKSSFATENLVLLELSGAGYSSKHEHKPSFATKGKTSTNLCFLQHSLARGKQKPLLVRPAEKRASKYKILHFTTFALGNKTWVETSRCAFYLVFKAFMTEVIFCKLLISYRFFGYKSSTDIINSVWRLNDTLELLRWEKNREWRGITIN